MDCISLFSGCFRVHDKNHSRVRRAHQTPQYFNDSSYLVRMAHPT
ncbi:hypothetical protein [Alysiella crassa]|nr:hypothetical protein [Alysiella crassa]